jgi:23S rRNA (uracil1939-C5)-methyltransferase
MFIDIEIVKNTYGGSGLGFLDGKAVFIPGTCAGEIIKAEITEEKKDYSIAKIIEIRKKSSDRIEPQCGNFMICGGCSYLHVNYETELKIKKEIIQESLKRIGRFQEADIPEIEIISSERFSYRSHARINYENGIPGFRTRQTNKHINLPETGCILLDEKINTHTFKLKHPDSEMRIAADFNGKIFDSLTKSIIIEKNGGLFFEREISLFYQANKFLRNNMLEKVFSLSGISSNDEFLDIDCGVGFFTLYLAGKSLRGAGIDINKKSILTADKNRLLNKIDNVEFKSIPSSNIPPHRFKPKTILIDPPRAGIDKKTRQIITSIKPEIFIYVSCNPATFSRDAADFVNAGFKLESLTLIDMFPCTHHIEIISKFEQ